MPKSVAKLKEDFEELRDSQKGRDRVLESIFASENDTQDYLKKWFSFSKMSDHVYPSQGLLQTPFDHLQYEGIQMLPQETLIETLRMRHFLLKLFNHPLRIHHLCEVDKKGFVAPAKIHSKTMEYAHKTGTSLSIGDIGAKVVGSSKPRISRTERYSSGPFVKLGRQARSLFVGSASPDVWNSAAAIATMAASHCLAGIPRNGITSDPQRQADLAKEVFSWLEDMADEILDERKDKKQILKMWKNNVVGTLSANPQKAIDRAKLLHKAGVRSFRIYSPEPGTGAIETLKSLRKEFGKRVEIFASHMIDLKQAIDAEKYGADGIFIGIGGGGRCITAIRSGSVVDWPSLLWKLRGKISIPVIVEGGASDHVATTLLLGAAGISVSRVVSGGTIESPSGALFFVDKTGKLFKPYGGEASARTKYLDGKLLPFNIPSFVEGETTKAEMSYVSHVLPTLTYNLHMLIEDSILALVFRNVKNLEELHSIDPSPLRLATPQGNFQRGTH